MTIEKIVEEIAELIEDEDIEKIKLIFEAHPESINHISIFGTWLHEACDFGKLSVVKLLLNYDFDLNLTDSRFGQSPLKKACAGGHLRVVELLLSNTVKLECNTLENNSLFGAITSKNVQIAKLLIESGINKHVVYRGTSGNLKNALSFARDCNATEIEELLLSHGCKMPVEGVDIPVNEVEEEIVEAVEVNPLDDARVELVEFMTNRFGPVEKLALQELLPIMEDVSVAINVVPPKEDDPFLTLFTIGMSDLPMKVPAGEEDYQYAELVFHLPNDWPHPNDLESGDKAASWPVGLMRQIAYFPHLSNTWLGGPYTTFAESDPPKPLGPNTEFTSMFLCTNPSLQTTLKDGRKINFYQMLPMHTDELDYCFKEGVPAFLERWLKFMLPFALFENRTSVFKKY